jgi:glycosyltransferase involved in cell wall biosynthesis
VLVVVVPVQVPALLVLARAVRGRRVRDAGRPGRAGPTVAVLAHNVVPHEPHPGDRALVRRILRAADAVVVHSAAMADQVRAIAGSGTRVAVTDLPPHLPGGVPERVPGQVRRHDGGGPVRVLCLGMVRDYKGIDLLLEAAREVPGVEVTVAGEQWGAPGERVRALAAEPGLAGRVRLRAGYVPGAEVPALLAAHDVLALPYRSATASQNVLLAHAHGLPVLATRVGTFEQQVRDGVDGLLVPPGDVAALADALRRLREPGRLAALQSGVPAVDLDGPWTAYVATLAGAAGRPRRHRVAAG